MSSVLLHVGLPKTGSTLLQKWFALHPELVFLAGQEGGPGSTRQVCAFAVRGEAPRPKWYVVSDENLAVAWPSGPNLMHLDSRLVSYEANLARSQARVCDMLHQAFPGARVLLVTRGYRSYVLSAYSEYVKNGGPLDFAGGLQTFGAQGRLWLDYDHVIGVYTAAFGADNVLVLPYELLRDDAPDFLRRVETWLGLSHFEADLGRVNPALTPQELYWYPKVSRLVAAVTFKVRALARTGLVHAYVRRGIRDGALRPMVRTLGWFGDRQVRADDCPSEYLAFFRGKGRRLLDSPAHAAYAAEYFLDES